MEIRIDRSLGVKITGDHTVVSSGQVPFYVVGKLLGAFDGERTYDQQDAIRIISSRIDDMSALLGFMRNVVGKCYLITKHDDKVVVVCSPSSPGLFYLCKNAVLILSDDETRIYGYASTKDLDDMEVINMVISHHGLRSPFSTIFTSIKRVVGGQMMSVSTDLEMETNIYLVKSREELDAINSKVNDEENYNSFIKTMEATAQVISRNWDGQDRYLLHSGGIDSTALLIAFLKYDSKIKPLHWPRSRNQQIVSSAICDLLGVKPESLDYRHQKLSIEDKLGKIRPAYESGLGMISFWNSAGMSMKEYFENSGIHHPLVISGQNMDSLYTIDTLPPGFNTAGLKSMIRIIRNTTYRFLYTDIFYEMMAKNQLNSFLKLIKRFKKSQMNYDFYDYLVSIILPYHEHVVPFLAPDILPRGLANLENCYRKFKERQILAPLVECSAYRGDLESSRNLSVPCMNHMTRMLKRLRLVQATALIYSGYDRYGGYERLLPVSEGPLSNFLSTFQLTFKDMFFVKRFLYRYFRETTGKDYYSLKDRAIKKYKPSFPKKVFGKTMEKFRHDKPSLVKRPDHIRQEIGDLATILQDLIGSKSSILIDNCGNPVMKDYLYFVFQKSISGNFNNFTKPEIMEIERFANMELLLRKLNQ